MKKPADINKLIDKLYNIDTKKNNGVEELFGEIDSLLEKYTYDARRDYTDLPMNEKGQGEDIAYHAGFGGTDPRIERNDSDEYNPANHSGLAGPASSGRVSMIPEEAEQLNELKPETIEFINYVSGIISKSGLNLNLVPNPKTGYYLTAVFPEGSNEENARKLKSAIESADSNLEVSSAISPLKKIPQVIINQKGKVNPKVTITVQQKSEQFAANLKAKERIQLALNSVISNLEKIKQENNLNFSIEKKSGLALKVSTETKKERDELYAKIFSLVEPGTPLSNFQRLKGQKSSSVIGADVSKLTGVAQKGQFKIEFKYLKGGAAHSGKDAENRIGELFQSALSNATAGLLGTVQTAGFSAGTDIMLPIGEYKFYFEVKTQGGADFAQITMVYDPSANTLTFNPKSTSMKNITSKDPELGKAITDLWSKYSVQFLPGTDKLAANLNSVGNQPIQLIRDLEGKRALINLLFDQRSDRYVEIAKEDVETVMGYYSHKNDFIIIDNNLYRLKTISGNEEESSLNKTIPLFKDAIAGGSFRLRLKAHGSKDVPPWDINLSLKLKLKKVPNEYPLWENQDYTKLVNMLVTHKEISDPEELDIDTLPNFGMNIPDREEQPFSIRENKKVFKIKVKLL